MKYRDYGGLEIWSKDLSDNSKAYAVLNRSDKPREVSEYLGPAKTVRDLWKHVDINLAYGGYFRAIVEPHSVVVLKLTGE